MPTVNTVQTVFTGDARQLKRETADIDRNIGDISKRIRDIAAPVAAIAGVYSLGSAVETVTSKSIKYLSQLETANLGIASSFMLGGKYIDQTTGKALEGQQALKAAQTDSVETIQHLQFANLQTIATLDQIIRAYQEGLPVAQTRGFNRSQVEQFTTAMVQAAGAIDASGQLMHQLGEETRSILTGSIDPRTSRIATVLGLRNEDIRQHSANAQQLFDFLMAKLSAYSVAGAESQKTMAGLWSNVRDIAMQAGGQTFQPLFEVLKFELTKITSHMVTIDEKTRKINWNPEFIDGVTATRNGVNSIVAEFYRMSMLLDVIGGEMTAVSYEALKTAEIIVRFMTIGQYGDNLAKWAEDMKEANKTYEERYQASDKALQKLADREVGLAKDTKSKVDAIYQQNKPGADPDTVKRAEKERQRQERISLIMAQMRDRDLLIGKQKDEKELIQLDQKHRQELKQLRDQHASKALLEEAAATQARERSDLIAQQRLDKSNALAMAEARIAQRNFEEQAAWQDKLDQYQLKTGKMGEIEVLDARYGRERQLLNLKQEEIGVQIDQEKSEVRLLELRAEFLRIEEQIDASKQDQANETALLLAREEQLALDHSQKMVGIAAAAYEARLQFIGQDQAALDAHFAWKQSQLNTEYEKEMERLDLSQAEKLAKKREYEEQSLQLQTEYAQRQADVWWNNHQTQIGFAQQMTTMGLQMLLFEESQRNQIGKRMLATGIRFIAQSLQQFMFAKAKEHLITAAAFAGQQKLQMVQHTASLGMLEAEAVAWAAFLWALAANPYGGQAVAPAATMMSAVAGVTIPAAIGTVNTIGATAALSELSMAAAWTAGGILAGAAGEAGASAVEGGTSGSSTPAGYGAGSPASPVVTSTADSYASSGQRQMVVNVHIHGVVDSSYTDWDALARQKIIPSVAKATRDGVRG